MKRILSFCALVVALNLCLQSCYSVKLTSRNGTLNPCVHGDCETDDWANGYQFIEFTEVVDSNIINKVDELKTEKTEPAPASIVVSTPP